MTSRPKVQLGFRFVLLSAVREQRGTPARRVRATAYLLFRNDSPSIPSIEDAERLEPQRHMHRVSGGKGRRLLKVSISAAMRVNVFV
jgi:hypothetical protein